MGDRLVDQPGGLLLGALGPEQAEEGLLARLAVLAQLLAGQRLVALGVEQIVGDLEGEADITGIAAQPGAALRRKLGEDRAAFHRAGDQRAGLHRLEPSDGGQVEARFLGLEVHHLPARHSRRAGAMGKAADQLDADEGIWVRRFVGKNLEGERMQAIAGKDRGRLVEFAVDGGLAAADIVVVHRGQIVMDQRIDMDAFERSGDARGACLVDAEKLRRREDEKRAKPLAAADRGVAHRAIEPFARIAGNGEQLIELPVDLGGGLPERRLEREAGLGHRRHSVRGEGRGAGRPAFAIGANRLDPRLRRIEPRRALAAQLVAALVQVDCFLQLRFAAFEAADDPLQLFERFLEGKRGDVRFFCHAFAMRQACGGLQPGIRATCLNAVATGRADPMFTSTNPATGETVGTHAEMDADAIELALSRAEAGYKAWRNSPLDQRTALLTRIADQWEANKQHLAEMAVKEMGKPIAGAVAEVEKCILGFRHYAEHGPSYLEPVTVATPGGGHADARWLPMGPVLAVMPWNFPYWQVVRFLAPTIMAGNVALLKHASSVQGCAALIQQLAGAAGAPDGLFQNLAIRSDKVAAIIADKRVVAVTLTGSEGAGAQVAQAAGRALKKVVLELGGSDPLIVMPSADLDAAAKTAVRARIQNAGQSCICAKRMIVHADVYDAFMERFTAGMKAVKIGDPMDKANAMGPLSSVAQRDTVLEQVARAQAEGATLLFGAEKIEREGAWMTPGVLVGLDPESHVAKEEIFGPVAAVYKIKDIDEAIALANDVPYGLGSAVWTRDDAEIERFARDIESGMTAVNSLLSSTPAAPFGGVKLSGHGRELGPWGMHEFMNLKAVMFGAPAKAGD